MFDLNGPSLTFNESEVRIKTWEVWFMTPKGLVTDFTEAKNICLANDWEPNLVISPVPVAIDEAGRHEIILRQ